MGCRHYSHPSKINPSLAGAWNTRKFQLIKNELIWLRSDENKHNFLNVAVDGASVRDVKIGAKK